MNNIQFQTASSGGVSVPEVLIEGEGMRWRHSLVSEYLSVAKRRKWLILGTVITFVLGGLVVTLLTTPLYKASALLEIQRENTNFADVKGTDQAQAATDNEFYQTQYGLLKSRALADRIAQSTRLSDDPTFFERFNNTPPERLFNNGRPVQTATARQERVKAAGSLILAHMSVDPERLSRLVEISFTSPDPELSRRIVNAWSDSFIQSTLERRFTATSYARKFLEDRLQQLRNRIDQSQRALVAYASRENIVSIPGTTDSNGQTSGERSLVVDDLTSLNRELSTATAQRVLAESRLRSGNMVKEQLDNSTSNTLRARRAELSAEYARMMQQFDPGYPPAKALQAQIRAIDTSLQGENSRIAETLSQDYQASLRRERQLKSQVDQLTGRVLDFRRRNIQYDILQREVDTNRQLYDALLQRYKEIGVAGGVGVNNIAVVDSAETPSRPSSPRPLLNIAVSLLLGLIAGAAIALLLEQIDEGFADPIDVQEALGLPLVGVTPKLTGETPQLALLDPKSPLVEAYASIVANLGFATSHGIPRTLAITSSRAAEGKSSTSYAIARLIARSSKNVLLIDADMRSPSIHGFIDQDLGEGLSNYLSGMDNVAHLMRQTDVATLSVITAGPQPLSTPELLGTDRLDLLLSRMTKEFDHVVIDLPPVMGFADAPLIASKVEGTLVMVAANSTHKNVARLTISRLQKTHAHLLGGILTMFDAKQANYGYGYGYGYNYSYGETKNEGL